MNVMDRKNGFTLVELLIVMAILAIMVVILIGIINPIAMVNKADDATRKKDLNRIKVAMEEYFSDKGCYPTDNPAATPPDLLSQLNDSSNCNSSVFSPWLSSWPCDPSKRTAYILVVESGSCPHWFKIYTNLENKKDKDIPAGWYSTMSAFGVGDGGLNVNEVNYGTSSTNVSWIDMIFNPDCVSPIGACFYCTDCLVPSPVFTRCEGPLYDLCPGPNVYTDTDKNCQVSCCMGGSPCP
jgi:prepilin-type N-terminal cleavage/methylation domain-containing protein